MLAEAASAPGREVCGLLFGTEGEAVTAIQPCTNVATDPADSFEIDPASLIAAHKAQRTGGPGLIGCYHSHPDGAGEPSLRDRESAERQLGLWLIVACNRLSAWRLTRQGRFKEVRIVNSD